VSTTDLTPWHAPTPHALPDLRAELAAELTDPDRLMLLSMALQAGQSALRPIVAAPPGSGPVPRSSSLSAALLARLEQERLRRASLYWVSADMTALTLAAAATPPRERFSSRRAPSQFGFVVFEQPIGGYRQDAAEVMRAAGLGVPGARAVVTIPIVAASWGPWGADWTNPTDGPVTWLWNSPGGRPQAVPDVPGTWVTFYSARGLYGSVTPGTTVGRTADGLRMTAADLGTPDGPVIQWDTEAVLMDGAGFERPKPDTNDEWLQALYTAWQLMGQDGSGGAARLAEAAEVPRPRAARKRDAREGITDPGAVRIVHVHAAHRPSREAAEQDAAASTGRRAPQWSCRWPVRPHRRSHCMAPQRHAAGECHHEDRIIPAQIRGPQDKPLRTGGRTVNVWDEQPE